MELTLVGLQVLLSLPTFIKHAMYFPARRENYFCQSYCLGPVQRGDAGIVSSVYIWRVVSKHESLLISRKSILYRQDMIPTVGFNMRKITKGRVTIKLWDIGGQPR